MASAQSARRGDTHNHSTSRMSLAKLRPNVMRSPWCWRELKWMHHLFTDDEDRVRLQRQWEATLHRTSMQLLKHLKSYHRALTTKLLCEVSRELAADSRSVAIPGVDINSCMKNPFFANTYSQLQVRKHRKLSKLRAQQQRLPKRQRKRRCRRRRKPKQKLDPLRTRPVDTVVNLSNVTLSEDETRVLSRGISFCPTPSNFDTTAVLDDLESYFRRVRLHEFFLGQPSEDNSPEARIFREPSSWMPPKGRDQSLEVYIKQVRAAVTKTLESQAKKSKQVTRALSKVIVQSNAMTDKPTFSQLSASLHHARNSVHKENYGYQKQASEEIKKIVDEGTLRRVEDLQQGID